VSPADPFAPVLAALQARPGAYLVAIAGIPGSGKTTFSAGLASRLPGAVVLPMDGYHLPRAQLGAEGLRRRGAAHTFDPAALRADLQRLCAARCGTFPAFDHAEQDPRPGSIRVNASTPLVIIEGLYLLLRDWQLAALFDFTVFLDCDLATALDRVTARHLACGLAATLEAARHRAESNDRLNAEAIFADGCRERADLVLR